MAQQNNDKNPPFWERGGSIVEYGLILGFSIVLFITIIEIVFNIVDWTSGKVQSLFGILTTSKFLWGRKYLFLIYSLPFIFYLIILDQMNGRINKKNWPVLFLIIISLVIQFDLKNFGLLKEFFTHFGIIFSLFMIFLVIIKVFGGADILFLFLLFLSSSRSFLLSLNGFFFSFLLKLAFCVVLGIFSKNPLKSINFEINLNENHSEINCQTKKTQQEHSLCPQFIYIFSSFIL